MNQLGASFDALKSIGKGTYVHYLYTIMNRKGGGMFGKVLLTGGLFSKNI